MITPSTEARRTHFLSPPPLHAGLDLAGWRLSGAWKSRSSLLVDLRREAEVILDQATREREMSERALSGSLASCADRNNSFNLLSGAIVAMQRATGLWAHPEQVMAALALIRGFLVEAATGEGKTLSVGLAAAVNAFRFPTCHVLTANDYLADRDAAWLTSFYRSCGLSAGCITSEMEPTERAANYARRITYATPKELVADFLRDRLALGAFTHPTRRLIAEISNGAHASAGSALKSCVLRGLFCAIVDEADHALIDDAVTPLIISRKLPNPDLETACLAASHIASTLQRGTDYLVNASFREIHLSDSAETNISRMNLHGIWAGPHRRRELIEQALQAREFFHLGHQYLISEGKIVIVDESTGRPMPQRTWRGGLHQAIEAKEGLNITNPSETLARLSFQRFFRFFKHLSGITGTAREAAGEFWQIYGLPMVALPTHRPCIREHWPDRIFTRAEEKWRAVVTEIERHHRAGRPILAGTRSVAASRHLARLLQDRLLDFELLNAEQFRSEAEIVARAGEAGRITIATNMAGRGTDIRLGPGVAALGGLHVIATERHGSFRVDRQLFGRAARQGDPGSAQAFVSLEDELLQYTPRWLRNRSRQTLASRLPGSNMLASRLIQSAQRRAERTAARRRHQLLQQDLSLDDTLAFAGPEL